MLDFVFTFLTFCFTLVGFFFSHCVFFLSLSFTPFRFLNVFLLFHFVSHTDTPVSTIFAVLMRKDGSCNNAYMLLFSFFSLLIVIIHF
jgi:hypothetical protein